jgi:hypothetical protein
MCENCCIFNHILKILRQKRLRFVINVTNFYRKKLICVNKIYVNKMMYKIIYRCPENGALPMHYGVKEITINVRKMLKKFYWTYLLIWRSLKVALNRSIILK